MLIVSSCSRVYAEDIFKEVNYFPYTEDIEISHNNDYFYKLNIQSGMLIDAKLDPGKTVTVKNISDIVKLNNPDFLNFATPSISFYAGGYPKISPNYTYDRDSMHGSYQNIQGNFINYKWSWNKEKLKPLYIKYLTGSTNNKDAYVIIKATDVVHTQYTFDTVTPAKLTINIVDFTDYNSIDAGYVDEDITEITPGIYRGYLFYQPKEDLNKLDMIESGDDKDFYKVKVNEGDKIKINIKSSPDYLITAEIDNIDLYKSDSTNHNYEGLAIHDGYAYIKIYPDLEGVTKKVIASYTLDVQKNPGILNTISNSFSLKNLGLSNCLYPSFINWLFGISCQSKILANNLLKPVNELNFSEESTVNDTQNSDNKKTDPCDSENRPFNISYPSTNKGAAFAAVDLFKLADKLTKDDTDIFAGTSSKVGTYSKFKCGPHYKKSSELERLSNFGPFDKAIPDKAKEIYGVAGITPFDQINYLQCTSYVAMAYNMTGENIGSFKSGGSWHKMDKFEVYENGKTNIMPELGMGIDIDNYHVGIVYDIKPDKESKYGPNTDTGKVLIKEANTPWGDVDPEKYEAKDDNRYVLYKVQKEKEKVIKVILNGGEVKNVTHWFSLKKYK